MQYEYVSRNRRRKRRKSHSKLIIFLLVVLIAAMGVFAAFTIFNNVSVKAVEKLAATKITDSSATLSWTEVKDSDGYFVYQSTDNPDKPKLLKKLDSSKSLSYSIEKLEPVTEYEFLVSSFKGEKDEKESKRKSVSFTTLLPTPKLTDASSIASGEMSIEWSKVKGASQYKVQYSTDEKFKKNVKKLSFPKDDLFTDIDSLKEGETYYVRIAATAKKNGKTYNSAWSEAKIVRIIEEFRLRTDIDPNKPMVALTFDDGPGYNEASDHILDVLEKYGAKATFFMVGKNAQSLPKNVKRKAELGMELGNHTWAHTHYGSNVSASDIKQASEAIKKITGSYPTAFRSPGGMTTDAIKAECAKENMALYYWSIDTEDWKSRNAKSVYNNVIKYAEDGDIILMHEIYNSTADAIKKIVPKLIKKGFQLVTCRELIMAKTGKEPVAGRQYVSGRTAY